MTKQKTQTTTQQYIPMTGGVHKWDGGYYFSVEASGEAKVSLVLYKKGSSQPLKTIPFQKEERLGRMWLLKLPDFSPETMEYNFSIDGKICQDPYAYSICGREEFGVRKKETAHQVRCGFLSQEAFDWEEDKSPAIAGQEMILYKVHVRGYTRGCATGGKKRGTFAGLTDKIPYWKELGINGIELMPAYEFEELPRPAEAEGMVSQKQETEKVNYWGYVSGAYFAPKRSYCSTGHPETEVREFVKALHQAGMECIMEFYFPAGTSSLLAVQALQFWKIFYHIDGFHVLGEGAPVQMILGDGILSGSKLFFSSVGQGDIPESAKEEGQLVAEYNSRFQEDMRRFLKSDENTAEAAAYHLRRQGEGFSYVNYMASQDGFTLNDLVCYNYKHNEANGENNHDGSDYNFSWNCGEEGPSRKMAIKKAREQQLRNSFLFMLLSQGIPMLYGGDEFGNTQEGNNNAYCQDNVIGWLDWKNARRHGRRTQFVKEAIAFRKAHPILHLGTQLKGTDYQAKGFPDISFHGERAWYVNFTNTCRLLGIMLNGRYAGRQLQEEDDILYIGFNFHWETRTLALPNLPEKLHWKKICDTSEDRKEQYFYEHEKTYQKTIEIAPRSIVVLMGKQEVD